MIDYSIFLLGNPIKPEAPEKAYAKAQVRELLSFRKFINHIASHNGVFSRGTVRGVIVDMCECLVEELLEGKKVELGELGSFWITLSSEGADSLEEFTSKNIKEVNIIFTPGEDFKNLISKAEFNLVPSRVAQAATLKAEKTGATVVDLEAARAAARPDSGDDTNSGSGTSTPSGNGSGTNTGGSTPSGGGTNTGGGSNTGGEGGGDNGGDDENGDAN